MEKEERSRAGGSEALGEAGEKRGGLERKPKNKRGSGREEAVNIEKRLQRCAPGKARKQKKKKSNHSFSSN